MLDAQLVVEPHVNPVHVGRQDVVGIFPARDPRVERDFAVRVGMQHHASAACSVRARQARPFEGFRDVFVEPVRLVPEAVVPRDLLVGQGAALPVEKVASLCRDDRAARSLVGDAVDGALQEIGARDDLVVIEEDDGVVAEDGSHEKPHIAHCAVSGQACHVLERADAELLEAAVDVALAGLADDRDVQVTEVVCHGTHTVFRLRLDAGLGDDEQDDAPQADDLAQGIEAARQLALLVDGSHVIIQRPAVD